MGSVFVDCSKRFTAFDVFALARVVQALAIQAERLHGLRGRLERIRLEAP